MPNVLVISPHPDDEAIGCGGAILLHARAGDDVHTIFLTSGEGGVPGDDPDEVRAMREVEAGIASQVLQTKSLDFWRLPDGQVTKSQELVDRLVSRLQALEPVIVYAPHDGDAHVDHRAAAALVRSAMRVAPTQCRMYEVWTPLPALDWAEDISDVIEEKIAAVRAHASQCSRNQFEDGARALARYRGALHHAGHGPYAEVFLRMGPKPIA